MFRGAVSAQAAAGNLVTIKVTNPDNTTETLTTTTLADLTYSTSKVYDIAGTYKAKAHGDADPKYEAWDSTEETFVITLAPRTGTLVVELT